MPGKLVPLCKQDPWLPLLHSNRRHKPAGLVPLAAAPLNCTPWTPCRKLGPWTPVAHRLDSPMLTTLLHYLPGARAWKAGPELLLPEGLGPLLLQQLPWVQVAQCQQASLRLLLPADLGPLCLAATAMVSESPCSNASRPQGFCCLVGTRWFKPIGFAAPWVPSTWYSVPGACHHTPKWTPDSRLCYSAGAKKLLSL
jgi:hypothetical protein